MNNTWIFLKAVPFEGPATFVPNGLKTKSDFMIMAKVKKKKNIFLPSQKLLKLFRAQYVPYSKVYLKL